MAYDSNRDKRITLIAEGFTSNGANVELAVYQYDNGPRKLRLAVHGRNWHKTLVSLDAAMWAWFSNYRQAIEEALK